MKTIHWGILGTGSIAGQFTTGLAELPATEVVAVGSRTESSAERFAERFNIRKRHASYEALVTDSEVDVIYIGSPHAQHFDNTLLALRAGKAVLCEKPLAINTQQATEMARVAQEQGLFLMEAVWTRFLPHMVRLREIIAAGQIGEVRMLQADFGFRMNFNPESRIFDPAYGGGALLDVGIYPINLAHMLFGPPTELVSLANLGQTGIDEENAVLLRHSQGQLSLLASAVRLRTPHEAFISGSKGQIRIHGSWWRPTLITVERDGHEAETFEVDTPLNGYNYEALEVNRCLREGLLESATMPLAESLAVMKTMDELRRQWQLRYPMEDA